MWTFLRTFFCCKTKLSSNERRKILNYFFFTSLFPVCILLPVYVVFEKSKSSFFSLSFLCWKALRKKQAKVLFSWKNTFLTVAIFFFVFALIACTFLCTKESFDLQSGMLCFICEIEWNVQPRNVANRKSGKHFSLIVLGITESGTRVLAHIRPASKGWAAQLVWRKLLYGNHKLLRNWY